MKKKINDIKEILTFIFPIFIIAYIFTFGLLFLFFWLTGAILSNYLIIILLLLTIPISLLFFLLFLLVLANFMNEIELDFIRRLKGSGYLKKLVNR